MEFWLKLAAGSNSSRKARHQEPHAVLTDDLAAMIKRAELQGVACIAGATRPLL